MVASYLFLGGYLVINYHDICQTYDIFGYKLSFNKEKIRIRISFPIFVYRSLTLKEIWTKNLNVGHDLYRLLESIFFTTVQIEKPALIAETFDPLFMHVYASFFILELGIKLWYFKTNNCYLKNLTQGLL